MNRLQTVADFMAALTVDDTVKAAPLNTVFVALMPWLQQAPAEEVQQLAQALLAANTRWHVALHDTLSWLDDEDWPALVNAALQSVQARGSMGEAERTVLEAASYQHPELLTPFVAQLEGLGLDMGCDEAEAHEDSAQAAMHLIFPEHYLKREIAWIPWHWHPSWHLHPGQSATTLAARVGAAASIAAGPCSI